MMLTADIPLNEEERDVVVGHLRSFLQSIDESGIEWIHEVDTAPLEAFDTENNNPGEILVVQDILKKLKEAF